LRRAFTRLLAATLLLWPTVPGLAACGADDTGHAAVGPQTAQEATGASSYQGKIVESVLLPGVQEREREHLLSLLPQKAGTALTRQGVADSIRTLFATGRFADIQAEVVPSREGVVLTFATSPNFFVGAVNVEGAPNRPNGNQIVNATKFQLGQRYTTRRLDRALENVRHLMEENGYHQARVTAESTSNLDTQQTSILIHITPRSQARVGVVNVTGSSGLSPSEVERIAHLEPGDRVTAVRVNEALQRLRKKFHKQNRDLAQISVAAQTYQQKTNSVDFTFQIDPGPRVVIYATGYHISRRTMRREIPVYEEDAVDEDLLNEGKRNLLDYMQTHGHFDAKVDIEKESDPQTVRVIYHITPGAVHKLVLVQIAGNKEFLDTSKLKSYLQIQPASRFLSHGRYSGDLLRGDVATLEGLYHSNGFRQVKIDTEVDDDYQGVENRLAVYIHIDEGPRTLVGKLQVVGNKTVPLSELPEMSTESSQPYSEENLANDRERILNYYFNHGFPNASLDITTNPSATPNREDVTFTIQEGERFFVSQVMVDGTDHTRDYVIDRDLRVRSGQPLSQQDLLDTQTRLYNLGIFSQVDTAVQNPEGTDPLKNVLVQVQEAKRYTFTYGGGLEFETGQPSGPTASQGATGVSPRVSLDVTRMNVLGRDQTLNFESNVGRLEQRGLISYTIPKLFDSEKLKTIYTVFYDNSLDVATFTSQRLEGKIDLRQQFGNSGAEPGTRPGPSTMTYRFDFRTVKALNFAKNFNPTEVALLSLPARVGGPGFTYIYDKRDNPLQSTKGNYFTLDAFAATGFFGSRSQTTIILPTPPGSTPETAIASLPTNFGRALAQQSSYYAFGRATKPEERYVLARSTTIGLIQPFGQTHVLPPGSCPLNPNTLEQTCIDIATIPLPEQFFAGGGNSHRGFGLNQAGPRDPSSGFPVGGTALFVNNLELRFPETSLPYLGPGFGFAIFHDMGNVFTAPHDMLKGLLRWHQGSPAPCILANGTLDQGCSNSFNNSGYDYTSHAVGLGILYRTPIGPMRFDFGYNLNPTRYLQGIFNSSGQLLTYETQRLGHFNVFFSIGQPF
jgi:outer membrane protein insertion porin family